MSRGAGRTISVRMPEGSVEELRAATGLPFGTLVRYTMMAYLERLRLERRTKEAKQIQDRAADDIRDIVNEQYNERMNDEHDPS